MARTRALLLALIAGVPPHAHCEICGTPVEVGQRRCGSAECERKFQEALKAKKRSVYMLVAVIVLAMLFGLLSKF
jgi:predicted nucleic acid-binding Zn ribbon protein